MTEGQTFTPQAEYLARLGSRFYLDTGLAIKRGYIDRATQYSRRQIKKQVVYQIVLVAYQIGVRFLFDENEQIAIHTTMTGGISLPGHRELHALRYTGRNIEGDYLLFPHNTFAAQ